MWGGDVTGVTEGGVTGNTSPCSLRVAVLTYTPAAAGQSTLGSNLVHLSGVLSQECACVCVHMSTVCACGCMCEHLCVCVRMCVCVRTRVHMCMPVVRGLGEDKGA